MHGPRKTRETDVKSNAHGGCESLRLSFGHAPASAAPIGALRDATVRHAHRHVEWTDRERRAVDVASTSACEPECPGVLRTRVLQPDRTRRGRAVSGAADPIVAWKHRRHALAPQPRRLRRQMDAVLARNAVARCSCFQVGGVLLPRRAISGMGLLNSRISRPHAFRTFSTTRPIVPSCPVHDAHAVRSRSSRTGASSPDH